MKALSQCESPRLDGDTDVGDDSMCATLYDSVCISLFHLRGFNWDEWERLLENNNDAEVWRAIN